MKAISMMFVKQIEGIEIANQPGGFIDGGLRIVHKSGSIVASMIAGKNLSVYQGVTIGYSESVYSGESGCPVIGDNVSIMANAVVCGNIKIGSNVLIGAGSVVTKDVPNNCVVVGNPAIIIKRDGVKVKQAHNYYSKSG